MGMLHWLNELLNNTENLDLNPSNLVYLEILRTVIHEQPNQRERIVKLLGECLTLSANRVDSPAVMKMKITLIDHIVLALTLGEVLIVLRFIKLWLQTSPDLGLLRHFFKQFFSAISPPFSSQLEEYLVKLLSDGVVMNALKSDDLLQRLTCETLQQVRSDHRLLRSYS
eukprot:c14443_g1_i1.p1 GENE.c14443_g1_i1~~c14443_g1_i1.p1  ORF type:complete len:180 (+),score=31.60 c14443_g1_i1:36-542(+)